VADRSEVAENDYNLNIPRYVDTFDDEEKIDLAAISTKLTALESEITTTNKEIVGFCKKLGIAPPF
jgi:type I restriction enzyme M protein